MNASGERPPGVPPAALDVLRASVRDFMQCVEALPGELWPAKMVNWTPRDVVAHLVGWNVAMIQGCARMRAGETPAYLADHDDDYRHVNAASVERYNARDKETLLRHLLASARDLETYLEGLDAGAWDADTGIRLRPGGRPVTIATSIRALARDYDNHRRRLEQWEQIAFYRARAPEYDQSIATLDQLESVKADVRRLGPFPSVLELACGTGVWTRELVKIGRTITAIDASPEMIAINRRKVACDRVRYCTADLFAWEPEREYDLVFAGFWLSHVPPDRMDGFLEKMRRAVRPGGTVYVVDQCNDIADDAQRIQWDGILQRRRVGDGRTFSIVKVYYHPHLLAARLTRLGFDAAGTRVGESFFTIVGGRVS